MDLLNILGDFKNPPTFTEKVDNVIFGLGNPGEQYALTRHNVGFIIADNFVENLDSVRVSHFGDAEIKTGKFKSKTIAVVKPLTFMNRSGDAVDAIVKVFDLSLSAIMVVVDDFNIPSGTLRVRKNGSTGGHNGLKSIHAQVGGDYPRMRVGIGPLPDGISVIDFVLGRFSEQEFSALKEIVPDAVGALKIFLENSVEAAMNAYNK